MHHRGGWRRQSALRGDRAHRLSSLCLYHLPEQVLGYEGEYCKTVEEQICAGAADLVRQIMSRNGFNGALP